MSKLFKRSTGVLKIAITTLVFAITLLISVAITLNEGISEIGIELWLVTILFFIVLVITIKFTPPDFKYSIRKKNKCVIFKVKKHELRIGIPFRVTIVKQYMIVSDEFLSIQLAYNDKVLKFLKEINK